MKVVVITTHRQNFANQPLSESHLISGHPLHGVPMTSFETAEAPRSPCGSTTGCVQPQTKKQSVIKPVQAKAASVCICRILGLQKHAGKHF